MIQRSLREWDYLAVGGDGADGAISRLAADSLIATARACRVGGTDGEGILINGHRRLRAQQVVGVLVSPHVTLEILPKIDGLDTGATRHRLVHMLARVFNLDVSSGAMTELGCQRHDLLEILVRLFCDRLFAAVHRGLPRRYVRQAEDLPALRGRMDVQRQFTVLATRPQSLACRYEELSSDIALNQIMKAAVSRLLGISRAAENQRRLTELSFAFDEVDTVTAAALPWEHVVLDRTNVAWSQLLTLAKLLLGARFQTTSSGDSKGFSLLFGMNTLFEEYIGRTLRRALVGSDLEVQLQGPQDHALVADDQSRHFTTRPDIVISHQGIPVLIIDTKWKRLKRFVDDPKRGVAQADVYQMMAYAQVYRCDRILLLYPHHDGMGVSEGLLDTHRIRGTENSRIGVASISISDLTGLADRLKHLVLTSTGWRSLLECLPVARQA